MKSAQEKEISVKQTSARQSSDFLTDEVIEFSNRLSSHRTSQRYRKKQLYNNPINQQLSSELSVPNFFTSASKELQRQGKKQSDRLYINFKKLSKKQHMSSSVSKSHKKNDEQIRNENKSRIALRTRIQSRSHIEKKSRTGPLTDNAIENWLNQALLDAAHEDNINKKEDNAALKKFEIDRNNLLTKGIKLQNIMRLYRSLFVYSIGFNDLLIEICNSQLLKQILWKVYARLLEYCSDGKFETMIGEIERDKIKKIEEMKNQIQKRQKLIEQHDERNESKNEKIFKELKVLEDLNKNLIEEKKQVLDDYHEAEQSFNEQILLRLKYETKINEIHGVYEQLRNKHLSFKEMHRKFEEKHDALTQKSIDQGKTIADLTSEIVEKKLFIDELEKKVQIISKHEEELEVKLRTISEKYAQFKTENGDQTSLFHEKQRYISQLKLNLKNAQEAESSVIKSLKNEAEEERRLLSRNVILQQTLTEQNEKYNQLMEQMRMKGQEVAEIEANFYLQKQKAEEKAEEVSKYFHENKRLKSELEEAEVQLKIQIENNKTFDEDLQNCYESIKQMKKKQNETTDLLDEANKYCRALEEMVEEKNKIEKNNLNQIEELERKYEEESVANKAYKSKIQILQEKISSEMEISEKKISFLSGQKDYFEENNSKSLQKQQKLQNQMTKIKQQYDHAFSDYKNEKFQRRNLDVSYKQVLTVMEQQNDHIKNLNIHISELNESIAEMERKVKNTEFLSQEEVKIAKKEAINLKERLKRIQSEVNEKKQSVSILLYEDLCATYLNLQQKYKNESEILNKKNNVLQKLLQKEREKSKLKKDEQKQKEKETENEKILKQKNEEIKYYKQLQNHLKSELKGVERRAENAKKQKLQIENKLILVESSYMAKINEKNKKIDEINKKYIEIKKTGAEEEMEVKKQEKLRLEKKLEESELTIKELKTKIELLEKEKQKYLKQKQQKKLILNTKQQKKKQKMKEQQSVENEEKNKQDEKIDWENEQKESSQEEQNLAPVEKKKSPKKSENIKNKIKGAFLYYHKQ